MNIHHPSKPKDFIIRKLQGLVWRLENTGDGNFEKNGELIFIKDICEKYTNQPFVVFDIGANVGEYTDMILKYAQTDTLALHLFEPQKTCFQTISSKFSQISHVKLNHFGLSNTTETTTLFKDFDQSGLASLHKRDLAYYNIEMSESEEISLERADSYIQKNSISKINLLKIDIEGHELSALEGFGGWLTADSVDFIQFEYGGANLDSHTSLLDLFNFFEARGFVVCKMMPHSLEIQKYKPRFENFMYQNWVAVNPKLLKTNGH